MNWLGEQSVFLKSDCKVMLLWNKSESLKNGSIGTFKSVVDGDKLLVHFEKVSTVEIDQVMWIQRNHQGGTIGIVHQFPLTPGCTVMYHTSQGLELPAVVGHLSKEFVTCLVYIAMSRVRLADTLLVRGFSISHVIPADPEAIAQCNWNTGKCNHALRCCRRKATGDESFFDVHDRFAAGDSLDGLRWIGAVLL